MSVTVRVNTSVASSVSPVGASKVTVAVLVADRVTLSPLVWAQA